MKAWPEVLRAVPDARLLLVGDGPNRRAVERLAGRLGVANSVIFTGSVPWTDVPAYTDAGDVYAMPCRSRLFGLEPEAYGIVFLEAQACGLPVLIGGSGGAPETLRGGGWGEVIAARDVHKIPVALGTLLTEDRPALTRVGVQASAGWDWDWGVSASRLMQALRG